MRAVSRWLLCVQYPLILVLVESLVPRGRCPTQRAQSDSVTWEECVDRKCSWAADCSNLISHAGAHQQHFLSLSLSLSHSYSLSHSLTCTHTDTCTPIKQRTNASLHTTPDCLMKGNPFFSKNSSPNHYLALMQVLTSVSHRNRKLLGYSFNGWH